MSFAPLIKLGKCVAQSNFYHKFSYILIKNSLTSHYKTVSWDLSFYIKFNNTKKLYKRFAWHKGKIMILLKKIFRFEFLLYCKINLFNSYNSSCGIYQFRQGSCCFLQKPSKKNNKKIFEMPGAFFCPYYRLYASQAFYKKVTEINL